MAKIWPSTDALCECRICGVQRQFHFASAVPHSADRDHAFVAKTIGDFEPGDLTNAQLVAEILAHPRAYLRATERERHPRPAGARGLSVDGQRA